MADQRSPLRLPLTQLSTDANPASSPLLPPPHAPNLAKARRSRPNAASIRRTQRALAQRERDRARAVDAQTHQVAHPLEDYLEHIRYNEAKLDRPRTGPGSDAVAAADSTVAASFVQEEDPAAQDFGLPVTVYDLAAAMVHDYCARHAASVGAAAAGSAANSPELASGARGRKVSAAAAAAGAAKRAKSPQLASLASTSIVVVDPADVARTSAFLRKVVTVAGIASSSVLFAMVLVDRLRQISLPASAAAAHNDVLSTIELPSNSSTNRRRSSRSRSRPRTGAAAAAASPRSTTSTIPTPLSASTPSFSAYSALSLSALDESRPNPVPAASTSARRKSTAIESPTSADPPILFTPLYAPPLPLTGRQLSHSTTTTPPRSRNPTTDSARPSLHTAASDPSLSTSIRSRSLTSSLPTLSLSTAAPTPTSPLTSPLLPLFPTLIHPSPVTARTWHPPPTLFITALMLADKSLFDSVYRTSDWAIFTPYAPSDLVTWEADLCAALAWDVAPPAARRDWEEWVQRVQMAVILGGGVRPRGADPSYFEVGVVVGRRMGEGGGVGGWAQAAVQVVARSAAGVVGEEAAARAARVVGVVGVVVAWLAVVVGRLGGG